MESEVMKQDNKNEDMKFVHFFIGNSVVKSHCDCQGNNAHKEPHDDYYCWDEQYIDLNTILLFFEKKIKFLQQNVKEKEGIEKTISLSMLKHYGQELKAIKDELKSVQVQEQRNLELIKKHKELKE